MTDVCVFIREFVYILSNCLGNVLISVKRCVCFFIHLPGLPASWPSVLQGSLNNFDLHSRSQVHEKNKMYTLLVLQSFQLLGMKFWCTTH